MTSKLNEETTYNVSITTSDGTDNSTTSINTDSYDELVRFLELAGVQSQNSVAGDTPCCGEGWADDSAANMDAAGYVTGGDAVEVPFREKDVKEAADTVQAEFDFGHRHPANKARPYSMDVHDYHGRPEATDIKKNFRRVNNYGDNALPQTDEDIETLPGDTENGAVHVLTQSTRSLLSDDFIAGIESQYGYTVAEQAENLKDGEPLDEQSLNALKLIAEYARNVGNMDVWTDIADFFELRGESFPMESENNNVENDLQERFVQRLAELAGIKLDEIKKPTDQESIEEDEEGPDEDDEAIEEAHGTSSTKGYVGAGSDSRRVKGAIVNQDPDEDDDKYAKAKQGKVGKYGQYEGAEAGTDDEVLDERQAGRDNKTEIQTGDRLDRKKIRPGGTYVARGKDEPEDKYASLARKYKIKDESIDEMESRLREEWRIFKTRKARIISESKKLAAKK